MTALAVLDAMPVSKQREAIEVELSRRTLLAFTRYTKPDYEINWHHRVVAAKLDQVLAGTCRRLMILEPPQNGKSEQVSRRFPAYALGKRPNLRIIACSYSDSLAQDMSRDVQRIMSTPEYGRLFPRVRLAESRDAEKRTQGQFDVVGGTGYYVAAGIMGAITGKTSDLGIIDDPIKNRAEAESETYRDRVWEQYISAFATRQFGTEGAIILCLTRWHEDDLAGRLLKIAAENPDADQWEVISLPAIAEVADEHREVGDPLWPAKYPLAELARRKAGMGEYDWSGLYQQRPAPSGGGMFKREWFQFVEVLPKLARCVRGWDTAATQGGGDWTAGVKIGEGTRVNEHGVTVPSGQFYIAHAARGQWSPAEVDAIMLQTATLDGKFTCAQREEKEGGASGKAVVDARARMLKGVDYKWVVISHDKVARSKPFRAQCEAGNVYILRTGDPVKDAWIEPYLTELCGFPTAKHDDQVDASSCAFNSVLLEPGREVRVLEAVWG